MPIPAEATAVHHITDDDVRNEPTFRQCRVAGTDAQRMRHRRLQQQPLRRPLLDQEFERAGVDFDISRARMIDVQTIYHKKEPRTLVAAYRYYCDKNLEEAHSALADTRATMEVLLAQLDRYDDVPTEVGALADYASANRNVDIMGRLIYDDKDREVINFGKYKGQLAEEVLRRDPGYYNWIRAATSRAIPKNAFTRVKLRIKK